MLDKYYDLLMGTPDDRRKADQSELRRAIQMQMTKMGKEIDELNHMVVFHAMRISYEFKQARAKAKSDPDLNPQERDTCFRYRVQMTEQNRLKDGWYRLQQGYSGMQYRRLKKGKYSYSLAPFKGQPGWVTDFFKKAEAKLTLLRKQDEALLKARKNLERLSEMFAQYDRLKNSSDTSLNITAMLNERRRTR